MVQSVVKSVVSVVNALEDSYQVDYDEFESEFQSGSSWITQAFESCKRQISIANGIEDESRKRRKAGSISDHQNNETIDKENSNPNLVMNQGLNNLKPKMTENKSNDVNDKHDTEAEVEVEAGQTKGEMIDVMSLKVADLREHLKEMGLNTSGLKKVLQNRLQRAIDAADEQTMKTEQVEENEEKEELKSIEEDEVVIGDDCPIEATIVERVNNDQSMQSIEEIDGTEPVGDAGDAEMEDCTNGNEMKGDHNDGGEEEAEENVPQDDRDNDEEMIDTVAQSIKDGIPGESTNCTIDHNAATDEMDEKQPSSQKKTFGQKLLKATRKVFSPSKIKSPNKNKSPMKLKKKQSPLSSFSSASKSKMNVCDDSNSNAMNTTKSIQSDLTTAPTQESSQPSSLDEYKPDDHQVEASKPVTSSRSSMVCNMTVDDIKKATNTKSKTVTKTESADKKAKTLKVVQSASVLSSKKATGSSSSVSSQKLRAMQEARKARLEELRKKNKPVHSKTISQLTSGMTTATSTLASGQKIKAMDAADRKRQLASQMRQKVAAAAAAKQQIPSAAKPTVANKPQSPSTPGRPEPRQQEQKRPVVQQQVEKPRSPMETYEMSDRGESDSDESDYEDSAPRKKIPEWAQRDHLRPALERQFLDGPSKIDPDDIFPEVSSCDLEAIFDQKKKRYIKRTSSGNWTKDRVTITEKLVYKRKMGFNKK